MPATCRPPWKSPTPSPWKPPANGSAADTFPPGNAHLIVEIDGRPAAVAAELEELYQLLQSLGAGFIERAPDEASCERIWQLRREFSYALRDTGLTKLNEDIVVPRSKLVELVEFAATLQAGDRHSGRLFRPCRRRQHPHQPDGRRLRRSARPRARRAMRWICYSTGCWPTAARSPANTASAWPKNAGSAKRSARCPATSTTPSSRRSTPTASSIPASFPEPWLKESSNESPAESVFTVILEAGANL